ncbi:MAG: hypothetical protein FJX75_18060 [Armatimonadetes bacterium]|nr:hypothetical protein [Armatimonadota bacterium]
MPHQYGRWDPNGFPVTTILGFVGKREPEARDLQFKSGDIAEDPNRLRNELAANVSALANGVGGLFVIGIETVRSRGEDIPQGWRCTQHDISSDRITSLLRGPVVEPAFGSTFLNGLQVVPFPCPDDPCRFGCGILVPKSDAAPHQVAEGCHAGKHLVATPRGLAHIRHDDLVTLIRGKPAALQFGAPTVIKHVVGTDSSGEQDVAFCTKLTVTNLGPGTVRDLQVLQWGPGLAGDPAPFPMSPGTLHPGVPTEVMGLETVRACRPSGRSHVLVCQTQRGRVGGERVDRRAEEGTVLEYSCVCQVVGDRGRSPLLAVRFTTQLGPGGIWSQPEPHHQEVKKDAMPTHVYLR